MKGLIVEHTFQTSKISQCAIEGDPDWWHDYSEENGVLMEASPQTKMAISICNRCDALDECRDFAMQYSGLGGVWGGMVPATRTRIQNNEGIVTIPFVETWRRPTQPWRAVAGEDIE